MTIFRKNIVTFGVAAMGISAVLINLALALMGYQYNKTNTEALVDTAKILVAAIGEDRIGGYCSGGQSINDDVIECLERIRSTGSYRISLIDVNGYVLWDSFAESALVNHIDRSEVRAALEGREGTAQRNSLSIGMRQIYAALPVYGSGDAAGSIAGVFRLSIVVPGFWQRIAPVALPFLVCAAFLVLAAFAAIAAFSRSLAGSLRRLADIAETAVGKENFRESSSLIPISGEAEEFFVLEAALRCIVEELGMRVEQAEAEGRQLHAILNGMSEAVLAMDGSLALYLVNPQARSLFGLVDAHGVSLLEATRSTELEGAALKVLADGVSLETEIKLRVGSGDGETRTEHIFQVFAAPLVSPGGVVMVMENRTRLARLEQMRKDFVANVSHELRTPIQLIKGFSETLLTPVEDKEQFLRCVEIIRKNVSTMENLTNDLLALASLEENASGASGMEEQLIAPLFAEAMSLVEPQAKDRKTRIIINCPDDLKAAVHGSLIVQALVNLLDNGIKYSPKKTRLWASAYRDNEHVVLEIRDEGIGISGEHLERIFERFYRVDRSHSRETGGTGLGLSIVRHIALLHKGTAEVESHAGEGSVFSLRIPG